MQYKSIDTGYIPNSRKEQFVSVLVRHEMLPPPLPYSLTWVDERQDDFRIELIYQSGNRRKAGILRDLSVAIIEATLETTDRLIRPKDIDLGTLVR